MRKRDIVSEERVRANELFFHPQTQGEIDTRDSEERKRYD